MKSAFAWLAWPQLTPSSASVSESWLASRSSFAGEWVSADAMLWLDVLLALLWRTAFACIPERRLVDGTGLEPATSALRTRR